MPRKNSSLHRRGTGTRPAVGFGQLVIDSLQDFVGSQPEILRWLAIALVSAIPFVEVYGGTTIGIVAGVHPLLAVTAAAVGNASTVLVIILLSHRLRQRVTSWAAPRTTERTRVRRLFNRFGVPGVSVLGHPTQISSAALIALGARPASVVLWQMISIVLWGTLVATLVGLGVRIL